jgi:hypothetical protein
MKKTIVGGCGEIRNGKAQQGRGGKYNNTKVGNWKAKHNNNKESKMRGKRITSKTVLALWVVGFGGILFHNLRAGNVDNVKRK